MATTKAKIKEANFVDEQVANEQAQPATNAEVANAQVNTEPVTPQPVAEAPVEEAPVEDVASVEEVPVEEVSEVEEEPRVTVDGDEVEIPATIEIKTQDLGTSVAMATGDTEPAELSPDVAESEPLVQDEPEVTEPTDIDAGAEPADDNLEVENFNDDDEIKLESLTARELDMIKEYRKYREENEVNARKAAEEADKDEPLASDTIEEEGKTTKTPSEGVDKFADEVSKAAEDAKPEEHKDVKTSIKESEEYEDRVEDIPEVDLEDEQEPVNLDMLAGIPDVNAEDDVMLDAFTNEPEGMSLDSIATFLKGVEEEAEAKVVNLDNEIKGATSQMQKSIDYLNSLLSDDFDSEVVESVPEEVVEDDLVEDAPLIPEDEVYDESYNKPVRESKVRKLKEDYGWEIQYDKTWDAYEYVLEALGAEELVNSLAQAMGDEELRDLLAYICRMNDLEDCPYLEGAEEDEEDTDYEESKKPVKDSKARKLKETKVCYELTNGSYKPWSGAKETWEVIERADKINALDAYLEDLYPEGIGETELNDILWFDGETILKDLGIDTEDSEDEDYENEELGEEDVYRAYTEKAKKAPITTSKKTLVKHESSKRRELEPRVQESYVDDMKDAVKDIKYPAGSKPIDVDNDNLVKTYEESARRKREALANFREAMRTARKPEERKLDEKFIEALHSPVRMNVASDNSKSWANNRIDEGQERLSFNNLKRMLENGFLG